jgi:hypothetical protein
MAYDERESSVENALETCCQNRREGVNGRASDTTPMKKFGAE